MNIAISSPYPLESPQGNSVSALRIASLIGGGACFGRPDSEPDVLIALHARRSAELIRNFSGKRKGSLVLFLTGTDLYHDIPAGNAEAIESLELAHRIVVMHEGAVADVPAEFRHKVRVCRKSLTLSIPESGAGRERDLVTVIGHLRPVKDPFRAVMAASGLGLRTVQIGSSLDPGCEKQARAFQDQEEGYSWIGNQSREDVVKWLQRSGVTVNSSHMEGAANAVLEAIMCGTPVLASRIAGNIALLGQSYRGYFSVEDTEALHTLLKRCRDDDFFYKALQQQVIDRQSAFSPEVERADWLGMLAELGYQA